VLTNLHHEDVDRVLGFFMIHLRITFVGTHYQQEFFVSAELLAKSGSASGLWLMEVQSCVALQGKPWMASNISVCAVQEYFHDVQSTLPW